MGSLPQAVTLDKEQCGEWYTEIELAEREAGETAALRYLNVALVVPVNAPHDDETGASLALFANTMDHRLPVAMGSLRSWPEFREAVREVATHRLPSRSEYMKLQAEE